MPQMSQGGAPPFGGMPPRPAAPQVLPAGGSCDFRAWNSAMPATACMLYALTASISTCFIGHANIGKVPLDATTTAAIVCQHIQSPSFFVPSCLYCYILDMLDATSGNPTHCMYKHLQAQEWRSDCTWLPLMSRSIVAGECCRQQSALAGIRVAWHVQFTSVQIVNHKAQQCRQ